MQQVEYLLQIQPNFNNYDRGLEYKKKKQCISLINLDRECEDTCIENKRKNN